LDDAPGLVAAWERKPTAPTIRQATMLDSGIRSTITRQPDDPAGVQPQEGSAIARALQSAILKSPAFSSIATDAAGVIQVFNLGAERMLGYAAADVVGGMTPADICDPHEVIARAQSLSIEFGTPVAPGFEALVFKASRGIEDIYELTKIRKDGSRFPAIHSVTALRDAEDAIIGYLLIGTDNTARKQIEAERQDLLLIQEETNRQLQQANAALRDREEKLSVTLNSIGDAVIATDAQTRVTLMNPIAEHLTGWTQEQAAGRPINEVFRIISQETRQPAPVPVLETLARGTIQGMANHTIVISRDGRECAIADSCAPIRNRDGQVGGAVLVFRDVTDEYAVQRALHDKNVELECARDLADKANQAKSEFLSSMSHELRTPLNAILGFSQLMESASPPPTLPQKRNIDQILKAGWYLLSLINEILDLALIESGTATLSHESVSLAEVLMECRTMIEPQARKRAISMTFPTFEEPCFVSADRTRVKQVLINLLFNAVKYNRPEGSVFVEYALSSPASIRVSVRDTGEGLDARQIGQLFQPFNRLGRQAGVEEGTGIGLMVTKRLVELMGGTIGVTSTVGVGSVFWFELNLTSAPQRAPGDAEPVAPLRLPVPEGTPLRTVLYVEDNPANLELVEQLISRRPELRLLSAVDGTLGVEFARAYQPDVILMDINLPGISGFEALRILRADPTTALIPVIALSANAVPRDVARALEAGFLSYLTKPIKVSQFMEALDAALIVSQPGRDRATKTETA
jgi:PAS domain S-box-containing protein